MSEDEKKFQEQPPQPQAEGNDDSASLVEKLSNELIQMKESTVPKKVYDEMMKQAQKEHDALVKAITEGGTPKLKGFDMEATRKEAETAWNNNDRIGFLKSMSKLTKETMRAGNPDPGVPEKAQRITPSAAKQLREMADFLVEESGGDEKKFEYLLNKYIPT